MILYVQRKPDPQNSETCGTLSRPISLRPKFQPLTSDNTVLDDALTKESSDGLTLRTASRSHFYPA